MNPKILVVDDSPTVQKVVAITLANENYELFQALNEDELFNKLKAGRFDLVLLDFTISQKNSGYETIKRVQENAPQTPVLLLLGQFDQVDEQILANVGIQEKLIKPFDSGRFIQRCRALLDKNMSEKLEDKTFEEVKKEEDVKVEAKEESWTVNSPKLELARELPKKPEKLEVRSNALHSEIESWGVPVPGVIGVDEAQIIEFPPVIDEGDNVEAASEEEVENNTQMPKSDDLDYPDMGSKSTSSAFESDLSVAQLTQATLSSKLISMDDLAPETSDRGFTDEQTEKLNLPADLANNLEAELDTDTAEDFWMADIEGEKEKTETPVVSVSSVDLEKNPIPAQALNSSFKIEAAQEAPLPQMNVQVSVDKDELIEKVKAQIPTLNEEEILAKLREALPPIVEQYIKDYCEKTVERVAWEVIPDLAENLIRRELRSIADSVPRDS